MRRRTLLPGALKSICGLDLGTSNTTLGIISGREPVLTALEAGQTTIPSAIFYEVDGAVLIGCKAIEAYVEGAPGRLMRSRKSGLGTPLIDETATRARTDQLSRRDRLLSRRGETARRAGDRPRAARRRAWQAGALRRQRAGCRPQGGTNPGRDRPRGRLR